MEVLNLNHGDPMKTIQQLLNEKFSNKIPTSQLSPPTSLPIFPSPLFPGHKPSVPHISPQTNQNLSPFSNVAAAAVASQRFSPYHYNRYTSGFLSSPYSSSLFPHFPQSPFSLHFPLSAPGPGPELERSHSPVLPDSPASPIVMERNEFCRN